MSQTFCNKLTNVLYYISNQIWAGLSLDRLNIFHVCKQFQECIGTLLDAVKNKDEEIAYHWSKSEEWATVDQLMQATGMYFNL